MVEISEIIGRLPSIVEYFKLYINQNIDLEKGMKCCCPFHIENTPSFSIMRDRDRWRCFGACKAGGDVVDLHRRNYKLQTREEALKSLNSLHNVNTRMTLRNPELNLVIEDERIHRNELYFKAIALATGKEQWLELDYIMSKYPVDSTELQLFIQKQLN